MSVTKKGSANIKEIKDFAGLEVKNFSDKPSDDLTTDEKISINNF